MIWLERLQTYFTQEIAEKGARSLSNGSEIEIWVEDEVFHLRRDKKKNHLHSGKANAPQLTFKLTEAAAEAVVSNPSQDLGAIGVDMLRLIWSDDPKRKIHISLNTGFLTLFSKGYFGVLTAGGAGLGQFLATKGFDGLGAFKKLLKK